MKRSFRALRACITFVRRYRLLSFALVSLLAGGLLQITRHDQLASMLLSAGALVALVPTLVGIVRTIQAGSYGVDILAALAIATAVVLQQPWAAMVVVTMLASGKSLEDFASHRARQELRSLLKRKPELAHIVRRGKEVEARASDVEEGDIITIRPGEVVPADAVVTAGASSVDESSLTGESLPASKAVDDTILSGSINGEGVLTARAVHTAADSQYQQIVRLVRAAAEHPAPFVRLADRYSLPFTVIALTIAGMAWILSHQPVRFLEVLVVATPCPLILAAPIALIAGMSRAARDGVIIKTGTALEQLAAAKTFAFDKTGTLTYGRPKLDKVVALKPFKRDEVLALAAAVEQHSNHALAAAINAAASQRSLKLPKVKHMRELAGYGLEAHAQGRDILVGRLSLLQSRGVMLPSAFDAQAVTQTTAFVAVDGRLAGYLTFHDAVRDEAKAMLQSLRSFGMRRAVMITGDRTAAARVIARRLGITEVVAEQLPGDKLRELERLKDRPVAFVGDGVNDAPALMAADVGVALGARGSTAASESADVVIMKDDLRYVTHAVAIAKRSFRVATQSVAIGIGLSIVLMLVFATGKFSPITGAIAQEIVDVLVILNALRAHRAKPLSAS